MKWFKHITMGLMLMTGMATQAAQVEMTVTPAKPVLLAGDTQTTWLKISLEGIPLDNKTQRPPINVALVLDKSGSMQGEKMYRAKEAAIKALDYLRKDDILSLVTYSSTVDVLLPATKFQDKELIASKIRNIHTNGNTALFAGVSKGARELRKFLDEGKVNRVILISDGLANNGPSTPSELGRLGQRLGAEGMSVTTIGLGLGYNEDLMVQLAGNSDGNHVFVEHANQLADIFSKEFGDLGSVVAQDVNIEIECVDGVKPVRILGRNASIYGNKVVTRLNQLYANQEKYLTLEVEVPKSLPNSEQQLAKVNVNWNDMATQQRQNALGQTKVRYSQSEQEVKSNMNLPVLEAVTEQIAVEEAEEAVKLRDEGNIAAAKAKLEASRVELERKAKEYRSKRLLEQSKKKSEAAANLAEKDWARTRKMIRSDQYKIEKQQSY